MLEVPEIIILSMGLVASLVGWYMVLSVNEDLKNQEPESRINSNEEAAILFITLVRKTKHQMLIHDDGDNSERSIYNDDDVMNAIRERVKQRPRLRIECLFNDKDQHLKLEKLADGECRRNILISYLGGDRPEPDIHYKVVDKGRLVHVSHHEHGADERAYTLLKAEPIWALETRRRISSLYVKHFYDNIETAERRLQANS